MRNLPFSEKYRWKRKTLGEYLTRSYSPRWQRRSYEYEGGGGGGGGAGDFRHRMASSTNMTDHATLSAAAAGRSRWVKECLFRSLMACSSAKTKMTTKMLESRLETLQWGRNVSSFYLRYHQTLPENEVPCYTCKEFRALKANVISKVPHSVNIEQGTSFSGRV